MAGRRNSTGCVALLCLALALMAQQPASARSLLSPTKSRKQASSCYAFDLTTTAGSSFGGVSDPLQDNGIASGSLYAVLHMCSHGILFPRTVYATSVKYYLDDPSHTGVPVGSMADVSPFQLSLGGLAAGEHSLTVVVTFSGAGSSFEPFVATSRFRTAGTPAGPRRFIPKYAQCGGLGSKCGEATQPCEDAQWPNTACLSSSSFSCRRQNQYYWQCRDTPF